jgi:hypothetical protein
LILIISSAMASSDGGMVRPSALAVFENAAGKGAYLALANAL